MKVALLLDGGWLSKSLYRVLRHHPTDQDLYDFSMKCIAPTEDLFRIYYYDSSPYDGQHRHPLTNRNVNFKTTPQYMRATTFLNKFSIRDSIAFRAGRVQFKGWKLASDALSDVCFASSIKIPPPVLLPEDIQPIIAQKGVDIKIGLDIAWLSTRRIVEKIILASNDSDFIPAMKFARRETIKIVVIQLLELSNHMKAHADEIRKIIYP